MQQSIAQVRRRTGGRRWRHEHALAAPGLDVAAELEVLDDAGHRVGIDAEEPRELADAGQGLVSGDAAGLDRVLELLGELPANGDRAVGIYPEVEGGYHCMSTLVH